MSHIWTNNITLKQKFDYFAYLNQIWEFSGGWADQVVRRRGGVLATHHVGKPALKH